MSEFCCQRNFIVVSQLDTNPHFANSKIIEPNLDPNPLKLIHKRQLTVKTLEIQNVLNFLTNTVNSKSLNYTSFMLVLEIPLIRGYFR